MRRFAAIALALVAALGLIFAASSHAAAAASRSSITGNIKDALGRPLADVELILQRASGKIVARTRSDQNGHFQFGGVAAGSYAVVANKSGFRTAASIVEVGPTGAKPLAIALESEAPLSLKVAAKRLEVARNGLSLETGGSVYTFNQQAIRNLPQGGNTALNQVLLQAPSVAQDSFGQVHIRGEHGEIQYRVNGIELPEGVSSGFSQTFSPRFAQSVSLLEGALPAQYGYHTAGVVSIQSKSGDSLNGGDLEIYGGQRYTLQPSFELGGSKGSWSYYTSGFYLQNDRGLEPPTPGPQALHDFTTIGSGFAYVSDILSPTTRLSFVGGFNLSNFQIPANPDQPQVFPLAGVPSFPSANIRETQLEQNYYGVLALQGLIGRAIDYQVAAFTRYSTLSFHPDQPGDLIFNGIASRDFRGDWASGLQGDFAYRALAHHTVRAGYYFSGERAEIDNHALVFAGGAAGPTSDIPEARLDNTALVAWNYGVYLQDEWRPLEKLTLNYGVRFDLYDGITRSDQFSPRVSAVYKLFDGGEFFQGTALHAAYARYFTPPPLESVSGEDLARFAGTTNAPAVNQDTHISPERAHYFDAGITQNLPYNIKLDLDSYYKKSTNLIDEGQFGATLVFTPFNYAKGRQYGVEFTISMNPLKNLTFYSNFAYSVAQGINIVSDQFLFGADALAFIRKHYVFLDHDQTFSQSAGIAYNLSGFLFTLNDIYGSGLRSGFANTGNQPFYVQFDAGIVRPFTLVSIGKLEARVAVVNLGDWIYPIRSGSGIGVFAPQFGPRRSFYGGLKWFIPFFNRQGSIQ